MTHAMMISRRLLLIGACAAPLAACGKDLLGPPEPGPIYPVRPRFDAVAGAKVNWALAILRPDLPGGLDTDRIALIQANGSMDYYANATYPDRLAPIVQQALLDAFEASGRIDAVAPEQAALHADYNLVTEVKDFMAHYSQPDAPPSVTVGITAKLSTAHGRTIVSSFTATQTATASANSAGAVTQALQQALGTCVTQIVGWALNAPAPKR